MGKIWREHLSWSLCQALRNIPGMEESLQDRRVTLRQLLRNVVSHVINSNDKNNYETIDPLAIFPADIREKCVDVVVDKVNQTEGDEPPDKRLEELLLELDSDPPLEPRKEHVQSESSWAGKPQQHFAHDSGDGGCGKDAEPLLEHLLGELKDLRWANVRLAIWHRLHSPRYSQILQGDLKRSCVQPKDFELMRNLECPLGFADSDQYKAFMSELSCNINTQLWELCGKTSALHYEPRLNGFWVILGGSAARFYSEGRFLDVDPVGGTNCEITSLTCLPVYDIHSDVNINVVLDVPDVSTLVDQMFGSPGHGRYASKQVSLLRLYTCFHLNEFANKWKEKLGRHINVVLPRTREACGTQWHGVWSFQTPFNCYHAVEASLTHQGPQNPTPTRDAPADRHADVRSSGEESNPRPKGRKKK
jgi:hypothetical protein